MRWTCGIGILALLVVGSTCSAQTVAPRPAATGEKAALVNQLRTAQSLLMAANYDYNGHRGLAAAEVHKAIRQLVGKHHVANATSATAARNPAAKLPTVHESQAVSDNQLRQAQVILQRVQAEINATPPESHPSRHGGDERNQYGTEDQVKRHRPIVISRNYQSNNHSEKS